MKKVLSILLQGILVYGLVILMAGKVYSQLLPTPDHIVIAILENHAYTQIIGSSAAPHINALATDTYSALFTQSYAIEHPSQPNYLDFYSGCNQGVIDDNVPASNPFTTDNLGRQLIDSGKTFITYSEDLPSVGYNGATSGAYARKHNPVTNWMGTGTNQIPTTTNQPFTAFPLDFTLLPTVCYVVPNQNNDMHNGTDPSRITTGDNWIYNNLNSYIQWAKTHNSLFILTFDEDNNLNGNRIVTIFTGEKVLAGQYVETINHYSVLRTIEDIYGLPYACNAAAAITITDVWTTCNAIGNVISDVLCFGGSDGSATVSPMNSTPPYTYLWSPAGGTGQTASNLTAGVYTCTITDAASCTSTASVVITQPSPLAANSSTVNDVGCFNGSNGSATVAANGGTPGYTYLWSPAGGNGVTASNLIAGTYTVTVTDANGCTISSTAFVNEPTPVTAYTGLPTNILCNGGNDGSTFVIPDGGMPGYTYLWSPTGGSGVTASNLTAGTYTVTVTDANGCSITSTATITEPALLTSNISSSTDVLCNGSSDGSAIVTSGGGTLPYTYLWTPSGGNSQSANNLIANTYTVIATDLNGCTTSATVTITEPPLLTSAIISSTDASCSSCNDGSAEVQVNGGTGTYLYLWTPAGGISATATNLLPGIYTCCATDSNGCTTCTSVTISFPSSVNEISSASAFAVYPNPAHDNFTITFSRELKVERGELKIFDVTGRVVHEQKISSQLSTVNCQLSAGVYFVKVEAGEKVYAQELVIE